MDKNKFRYCTLLLIDENNHSRIFISEENRYYIRRDNKSIHAQILNEFKDIRNLMELMLIITKLMIQLIIITKLIIQLTIITKLMGLIL